MTEIDEDGYLVYKGIKLDITQKQIYEIQDLGMDPMYFIEKLYKENTIYIRDMKIDLILGK